LRRMLQVLYLDVSKVDRVLHLAPSSPLAALPRCLHLLSSPARHPSQRRGWAPAPSFPFSSMPATCHGMAARRGRAAASTHGAHALRPDACSDRTSGR
jgi:hypothetical protein